MGSTIIKNYRAFWGQTRQSACKEDCSFCSRLFLAFRTADAGGYEGQAKGVKVIWEKICHPKVGGLGVRDLHLWNKVCMLQNLWAVWMKAGTLWVAWIEAYVLKGENVFQVQAKQYHSWSWGNLLKLRLVPLLGGFLTTYKAKKSWDTLRQKQNEVS
ncbi:hypothetical protein GOBAR_AA23987 [Gossypium barbadense]|uniref:Reverse transcriptase zinc-binding domain-containing protein n=1 Tax=Gossypium barbadense TaxID=3634 RepID=A0A2P5X019_GOSBA|nr:hypothetical protein GOBAR_AA23987 [Gossypium barbadense]